MMKTKYRIKIYMHAGIFEKRIMVLEWHTLTLLRMIK